MSSGREIIVNASESNPLRPYERLQRYWAASAYGPRARTHSEEQVGQLEARYGIRIPDEFREYLLNACSTDEEDWDDRCTGWWHLERIKNIPDEYKYDIKDPEIAEHAADYLFFADYSFWCWAWAIDCGQGKNRGRVAIVSDYDRFVADSFGEFVDLYLKDEQLVCFVEQNPLTP